MHVLGCGIDLLETKKIIKYINDNQFSFPCKEDVFTDYELEKEDSLDASLYFPLAFSCKEATFKAFGVSWMTNNVLWTDVELRLYDAHKCKVKLLGGLQKLSSKLGVDSIEIEYHFPYEGLLFLKLILLSK